MKCPSCRSDDIRVVEYSTGETLVCFGCERHLGHVPPGISGAESYVLVDLRSIVGNCVLFWRQGHQGYTCNLDEAHVFDEAGAFAQHRCRPHIDQPIPLRVATECLVHHVRREPLDRWLLANPDPRRIDPAWMYEQRERSDVR